MPPDLPFAGSQHQERSRFPEIVDEETPYLTCWFFHIRKDKDKFKAAINSSMFISEDV
jgi:hypothetical protein